MTGPHPETESPGTRPISVAELLARNGTIGAPAVTRRRRRRRGDNDAVTVAELTGELPIVRDDEHHEIEQEANGSVQVAEPAPEAPVEPPPVDQVSATVIEDKPKPSYWSEPEPRCPKSPPQAQRPDPQLSSYPRPQRRPDSADVPDKPGSQSDAETMSPDPLDQYADIPVDVMDSEVREAEPATGDSAYVRSYLQASDSTLFGGQTLADEVARRRGDERAAASAESPTAEADHGVVEAEAVPGKLQSFWRG